MGEAPEVRQLTAYALADPTVAITWSFRSARTGLGRRLPHTMMTTCSLTVNGPGFRGNPKIVTAGMNRAHARPTGNESNCATNFPRWRVSGMERGQAHEANAPSRLQCSDIGST